MRNGWVMVPSWLGHGCFKVASWLCDGCMMVVSWLLYDLRDCRPKLKLYCTYQIKFHCVLSKFNYYHWSVKNFDATILEAFGFDSNLILKCCLYSLIALYSKNVTWRVVCIFKTTLKQCRNTNVGICIRQFF